VFWDVTHHVCQLHTIRDKLLVPSSKVKQDSGGRNYYSKLCKVPKYHRSRFIVDYMFPVKPVLFLMENQHCSK